MPTSARGAETILVAGSEADAVLIDALPGDDAAGQSLRLVRHARSLRRDWPVFLMLGDLHDGASDADLEALMSAVPDGIVLTECRSGADIQRLGAKLAVREAELGLEDGATRILATICRAAAIPPPNAYAETSPRLVGLVWDEDGFAADLSLDEASASGRRSAAFLHGRAAVVIAARAASVPAYAAGTPRTGEALRAACRQARRDGFFGMVARFPAQVPSIRATFDVDGVSAAGPARRPT